MWLFPLIYFYKSSWARVHILDCKLTYNFDDECYCCILYVCDKINLNVHLRGQNRADFHNNV